MGLVQLPSVGDYWEAYTRYPLVADVMSRNRFQKTASSLHIRDNLQVTDKEREDKAWKIRRWFNDLNANFSIVSSSEYQCVDEIMVSFKGKSALKQYLPKKPTKWGFKLRARCSSSGFVHVFDIYQGKSTGMDGENDIPNCGLGGNVVLQLCSSLPNNRKYKVFADNYFSNFAMVSELEQRGFTLCGNNQQQSTSQGTSKIRERIEKGGQGSIS